MKQFLLTKLIFRIKRYRFKEKSQFKEQNCADQTANAFVKLRLYTISVFIRTPRVMYYNFIRGSLLCRPSSSWCVLSVFHAFVSRQILTQYIFQSFLLLVKEKALQQFSPLLLVIFPPSGSSLNDIVIETEKKTFLLLFTTTQKSCFCFFIRRGNKRQ